MVFWSKSRTKRCLTAIAVTSIASANSEVLSGPAIRSRPNNWASDVGTCVPISSPRFLSMNGTAIVNGSNDYRLQGERWVLMLTTFCLGDPHGLIEIIIG
jgi:hypothetical protein